jgi:hypothetical protein
MSWIRLGVEDGAVAGVGAMAAGAGVLNDGDLVVGRIGSVFDVDQGLRLRGRCGKPEDHEPRGQSRERTSNDGPSGWPVGGKRVS